MTMKRTPRPRDPIQLGKLMVDIATGQVPDAVDDGRDASVTNQKSLSGKKGGVSRASALSPEKRRALATDAAKARWKSQPKKLAK